KASRTRTGTDRAPSRSRTSPWRTRRRLCNLQFTEDGAPRRLRADVLLSAPAACIAVDSEIGPARNRGGRTRDSPASARCAVAHEADRRTRAEHDCTGPGGTGASPKRGRDRLPEPDAPTR